MKLQSKKHVIEAFRFLGEGTDNPKWFKKSIEEGRASETLDPKDSYITIYNDQKKGLRAGIGEWICRNQQGVISKRTSEEIDENFSMMEA